MHQLRRGVVVLRRLPARIRAKITWRPSVTQARDLVAERGRAIVPVAQRALAGVGKGLDRSASGLGRSAVASGRGLRSLSRQGLDLGARGLVRLRGGSRTAAAAAIRGARRLAVHGRRLAVVGSRRAAEFGAYLWQRRAFLRALGLRGFWWAALALLWFGGRALLDLHAPLAQTALPIFLIGLGLCLPLLFAAAARLRWAGFALGASHAALAVLVWTITTSG